MILFVAIFLSLATGSIGLSGKINFPEIDSTSEESANRIVGGDEAKHGQFPYQAGLRINKTTPVVSWCGGSLIAENYVLTAAHCAIKAIYIQVYLGAHKIHREDEEGRENIIVLADDIIIHKNYYRPNVSNDIALLKLPVRVQLTERIQVIALPTYTESKRSFADEYAIASGWGRNANNAAGISPVLRYATVRVQAQVFCKHFFRPSASATNMCTDTGLGQGICYGDSGGPLAYHRETTPVLIGLSSFVSTIGCVAGWPSGFTRVGSYLEWISQNSDIKILQ